MTMTVAEARTEIKSLFEKADLIEKKYPEGEITNNEDSAEVKRLLAEIDGLEAKLSVLEDAEARRIRILDGLDRFNKPAPDATIPGAKNKERQEGMLTSPGDQFIQSIEYRNLKLNHKFDSQLAHVEFGVNFKDGTSLIEWQKALQYKTLVYGSSESSGGGFVLPQRAPGYVDIRQREITVMDLIPRVQTESDSIEYVKEDTFTNAAAATAEATVTTGTTGTKPESALAYSVANSPVVSIAHWIPVTNRMLADSPAIRGIINGRLLLGLDLILESAVLAGAGAPSITGILSTAGINFAAIGTDSKIDYIYKARTAIRVTGHGTPTALLIHPSDWQLIRLTRQNAATGTLGDYLMGPPSQAGATTLWGIPVVESEALTVGTALLGDYPEGCTLFDREQSAVRVGTIDQQFVRNMQTILAELRVAFVVWRPAMFSKVTGMNV